MNHNNINSYDKNTNDAANRLTRGQKLLRRALPFMLLMSGGSAGVYAVNGEAPEKQRNMEAPATATTTTYVEGEFGGSEEGWGIGSAQNLIKTGLFEGAVTAYSQLATENNDFTISQEEVEDIVQKQPTYEQAGELLTEAGYKDIMPEAGDVLGATLEVTVDTNKTITYEVVDANIEDLPNSAQ